MTTPLFPSVIAWNVLDGGTDAQDGNNYPGPALQDYAAAVVGAGLGKRILFQGVANTYTEDAAAFNDALLDSILAANTTTAKIGRSTRLNSSHSE